MSARVTCEIRHGSNVDVSTTFTGTVAVVARRTVEGFHNYAGFTLCTVVDFTSDATPTVESCRSLIDLDDLCPILASLSPGVAGVVTIDETGDTAVLGTPILDCPPRAS